MAAMMKDFQASMAGMLSKSSGGARQFCAAARESQAESRGALLRQVAASQREVEFNAAAADACSRKAIGRTVEGLEVGRGNCVLCVLLVLILVLVLMLMHTYMSVHEYP
jgi:hypothetical protein